MSDNPQETWREVVGFPAYEVSDLGNFRNRKTGRMLKTAKHNRGYLRINLGGTSFFAHRVVLRTFGGECPPGHQTAHLNACRTDNRLVNLAWVTPWENGQQRCQHGNQAQGTRIYAHKLDDRSVVAIRALSAEGVPKRMLARAFGVRQSTVQEIISREGWAHVA